VGILFTIGEQVSVEVIAPSEKTLVIPGTIMRSTPSGRLTVVLETGAEVKFNKKLEHIGKHYLTEMGTHATLCLLKKNPTVEEGVLKEPLPRPKSVTTMPSLKSTRTSSTEPLKEFVWRVPKPLPLPENALRTHNDVEPGVPYVLLCGGGPIPKGSIVTVTGMMAPYYWAPKVSFWEVTDKKGIIWQHVLPTFLGRVS